MLNSIRIQNFRSIRDAEVKLGQVNLFIGPNNSGKSNFLKGIYFVPRNDTQFDYEYWSFRTKNLPLEIDKLGISLIGSYTNETNNTRSNFGYTKPGNYESTSWAKSKELQESRNIFWNGNKLADKSEKAFNISRYEIGPIFQSTKIYSINPSIISYSSDIQRDIEFKADGKNIVSFLYNLKEDYRQNYSRLESDFATCIDNFIAIGVPRSPVGEGFRLRFFDTNYIGYWAEEVSEGVLYFLALLCIVHQPNPPKLLLLEEPEKGIHPRRIREVMDFIFELARLRDIQIILTSHSPYVVDHFADIPECISVFDRENGETVVRNAADIIEETNAKLNKPIRYSDALGEHWVSGFLGGVPA